MNTKKALIIPFPDRKFITVEEFKKNGFSSYMIRRMESEGKIRKINRKAYENLFFFGEASDFLSASAFITLGVIGLMSAAVFHGLSSFRPKSVSVCVPQNSRVWTLPAWPPISIHYFSKTRFQIGTQTHEDLSGKFLIFDREKTVCDVLFYRHKIGIENSLDVLKNYLRSDNRDINKLVSYSQKLRCFQTLKTYLEGML